jgi:hypothetical protein
LQPLKKNKMPGDDPAKKQGIKKNFITAIKKKEQGTQRYPKK